MVEELGLTSELAVIAVLEQEKIESEAVSEALVVWVLQLLKGFNQATIVIDAFNLFRSSFAFSAALASETAF